MEKISYSVALCTYNGSAFIRDQVESILSQTVPPSEIIVCDDGSTDDSLSIIEELLHDSKVKYSIHTNKTNIGVTRNFIQAISYCTKEIIFTSDQDDVWLPCKAEHILSTFSSNKNALVVFSDGELVDSNIQLLHCSIWERAKINPKMLEEKLWFEYLCKQNYVTGATMALRKSFFDTIALNDKSIPEGWFHDYWIAWCAALFNGLFACNEKLILYRQHSNNVVGMTKKNLKRRLFNYINSIENIYKHHCNQYRLYLNLEQQWSDNPTNSEIKHLHNVRKFWERTYWNISNGSYIKGTFAIIKAYMHGDYKRYYTGLRGAYLIWHISGYINSHNLERM